MRQGKPDKFHHLSYGQQSIYLIQKSSCLKQFPNITMAGKVLSDIDIPALKKTFQLIINRHPSLRTRYVMNSNTPEQQIRTEQEINIALVDASEWDGATLKKQMDRVASFPFNLEKDPLMKATIFLVEPGEHILLLTFHHIAVDLWSLALIFEEIRTIYPVLKSKKQIKQPSPGRYLRFIQWQEGFIKGPEGKNQLDYWKRILQKKFESLELSGSVKTGTSGLSPCSAEFFKWGSGLSGQVLKFAKDQKTTPHIILLSAFFILLSYYSGKKTFFIKSLGSGRTKREFENTIGLFVNPFLLPADLTKNPDFHRMVLQTKNTVLRALDHQDYPFPLLWGELLAGHEFFMENHTDIQFIMQTPHLFKKEKKELSTTLEAGALAPGNTGMKIDLGGLVIEKINLEEKMIQNDISIHLVEIGGEISGSIYYKKSLFTKEYIHHLTKHFREFLRHLLSDPGIPVLAHHALRSISIPDSGRSGSKPESENVSLPSGQPEDRNIQETEEGITAIWRDILRKPNIQPGDDFFELGGHSISAMQIVSRIKDQYHIDLPLWELIENPTIAQISKILQEKTETQSFPPPRPVSRQKRLPMSFSQERLWFLDRMMEGKLPHTIPLCLSISGPLNMDVIHEIFRKLAERHEILRTSFSRSGELPVQIIHKNVELIHDVIDLTGITSAGRTKTVRDITLAESQAFFNLEQPPLFRSKIVKLGSNDYLLFVTFHHIIMDGMSLEILMGEFAAMYGNLAEKKEISLPPVTLQYADFAYWQRNVFQPETNRTQIEFWKEKLKNCTPLIFPEDKPRPPVKTYRGASQQIGFTPAQIKNLRSLAAGEGITMFMLFLTIFKTILYRYTGSTDISIGTPVNGREMKETENMIGCFLNILILRTGILPHGHFLDNLHRVKDTVKDAFDNQDLPFESLIEILNPRRDLSHDPFFSIMFAFQKTGDTTPALGEKIVFRQQPHGWNRSVHDFTMFVIDSGNQITAYVEYNTDLYSSEMIGAFCHNFQYFIDQISKNLHTPIGQIQMTKTRPLTKPSADTRNFVDLFQKRLHCHAAATAVSFKKKSLTYEALNREANRVAWYLLDLIPDNNDPVGICLPPSPELIIGILGILKSGKPFVPLDHQEPLERIQYCLEDTSAALIITGKKLADRLNVTRVPLLSLDAGEIPAECDMNKNPGLPISPDMTAYIMFTSGSTGKPKGVMVPHRALGNYTAWSSDYYQMSRGDGVPLFSSPAVDFSITSILSPLLSGQKVIIIDHPIYQYLSEEQDEPQIYSFIKLTPGHLQLILKILEPAGRRLPAKALILGGEELHHGLIENLRNNQPDMILYNEYGPTEATVGCTVFRFPKRWKKKGPVPIGKPIPGTVIEILDENRMPLPPGMAGELYIGGEGTALGYLNDQKLTEEKFVTVTIPPGRQIRMYKSGDRAIRMPDGTIQFLGREDQQFKIMGYRVEPAEIESALRDFGNISQAAVIKKEVNPRDQEIWAFISAEESRPIDIDKLKVNLGRRLPRYMVPRHIFQLPEIPMTRGNKIDRKKLGTHPVPKPHSIENKGGFSSGVQKKIAAVMSEILSVTVHGPKENFFSLGGHSLLAILLVDKINRAFGSSVKIIDLFQNPTVEAIESLIIQGGNGPQAEKISGPSLTHLFESGHSQNIIFFQPGSGIDSYKQIAAKLKERYNLYTIKENPRQPGDPLPHSLYQTGESYAELIRKSSVSGPVILIGWSLGAALALSTCRSLEERGEKPEGICLIDPSFLRPSEKRQEKPLLESMFHYLSMLVPGQEQFKKMKIRLERQLTDFFTSLSQEKSHSEKIKGISEWIQKKNILDDSSHLPVIEGILSSVLAYSSMLQNYVPQKIDTPLFVYFAGEKKNRSLKEEKHIKDLISSNIKFDYAGKTDHFSIIHSENASETASKLQDFLK